MEEKKKWLIKFIQGKKLEKKELTILSEKQWIRKLKDCYSITASGKNILEDKATIMVDAYLSDYRKLFKGVRPKGMGDKNKVRTNLIEFLLKHNFIYSMSNIISNTESFIKKGGFYSNNNTIRQADYHIYKRIKDEDGTIRVSDLLTILEDEEYSAEVVTNNWTEKVI